MTLGYAFGLVVGYTLTFRTLWIALLPVAAGQIYIFVRLNRTSDSVSSDTAVHEGRTVGEKQK
jgi:hypothetical protein